MQETGKFIPPEAKEKTIEPREKEKEYIREFYLVCTEKGDIDLLRVRTEIQKRLDSIGILMSENDLKEKKYISVRKIAIYSRDASRWDENEGLAQDSHFVSYLFAYEFDDGSIKYTAGAEARG